MRTIHGPAALLPMSLLLAGAGLASAAPGRANLADLSLEQLAAIEITSVSRRPERLQDAPAAIFVIDADMVRRSGATSLAEALRLAPNLQVARIDASQYAISARGFNNAIGNKLLVLIDGRTVYTSFFSGVFWDQQDVMLDDVDRIEVISGPGGTLWGANAVNGVINVITREAAATQGTLLIGGSGDREQQIGFRQGFALAPDAFMRIYAQRGRWDHSMRPDGVVVRDAFGRSQLGLRADFGPAGDRVTVQGDIYRGRTESRPTFGPVRMSGANLLARLERRLSDGSSLRVQAYVDRTRRDDRVLYSPHIDTFDLEAQHDLALGDHRLLWGGGHRRARDKIEPGLFFGFVPPRRTLAWTSLFMQDEFALNPQLTLTAGAKAERNDYTGWEFLPSLRLAWKPADQHLLWGALSRAVRAPARLDRDIRLPPNGAIIGGGDQFVSEVAKVLELGYRGQPSPTLNVAATLFHHDWDRLRSGQRPPRAQVQNMIAGHTQGLEANARWQVTPDWRLGAGLTLLRMRLALKPGSPDPEGPRALGNDPKRQWTITSSLKLSARQELDLSVRHAASLPYPPVPAYTALDLRWAWMPRGDLELALVGRNVTDRRHLEFRTAINNPGNEIERQWMLQLRWSP